MWYKSTEMPSFSEARVVCRPSLPADTGDVLAFTKHIWEGRDYIHLVWDEWLTDPNGLLVSAQFGRGVVGIAKVTPVFPGQWWLHGLRVDPAYQGLRIGSQLHDYINAWWLEHGDGAIRLLTSTKRVQVHHLCERTGYQRVGEIITYRRMLNGQGEGSQSEGSASGNFVAVSPGELREALAYSQRHLQLVGGLMDTGWRFVLPDAASLADRLREGRLHWWRGRQGLAATWEGDDDDGAVLGIGFVAAAQTEALSDILRECPALAEGIQAYALFWLAPMDQSVQMALESAGFATDEDSGVLFERRHPTK